MGCQIGDQVQIVESRPLSRDKRWVVESILKHEIRSADTVLTDSVVAATPAAEVPASPATETPAEA
jgi:hypothetical protein